MAIDNMAPQAYTDISGLAALKRGAKAQTPEALREAARQFESIFTRMMLKSMREASSGDPLFDSQQSGFYRDMFDDQIAVNMSRGHGLGLADQLVQQLQRAGLVNAATPSVTAQISDPATHSSATQTEFVRRMLPSAIAAGRALGVDPSTLLAQAALETGWGQSLPGAGAGRSSNNLFGIKAGASWRGSAVGASTQEFVDGAAQRQAANFRAYDSLEASFADYVALLKGNPRYAGALDTGSDTKAFAAAVQRAGYATDPRYADKLVAVTGQVRDEIGNVLKRSGAAPITSAQASGS